MKVFNTHRIFPDNDTEPKVQYSYLEISLEQLAVARIFVSRDRRLKSRPLTMVEERGKDVLDARILRLHQTAGCEHEAVALERIFMAVVLRADLDVALTVEHCPRELNRDNRFVAADPEDPIGRADRVLHVDEEAGAESHLLHVGRVRVCPVATDDVIFRHVARGDVGIGPDTNLPTIVPAGAMHVPFLEGVVDRLSLAGRGKGYAPIRCLEVQDVDFETSWLLRIFAVDHLGRQHRCGGTKPSAENQYHTHYDSHVYLLRANVGLI